MITINYLAVLIAAIVQMVVGALWYGPFFGKQWMKLMHHTGKKPSAKEAGKGYVLGTILALVMASVLALFIDLVGATTILDGLQTGFWLWLGFIAPVMAGGVLWEGKSWTLYLLNVAYWLVSLILMGMLLAVWV